MITLRPYQETCINDIYRSFYNGIKHAIITAPTGSGKTIIFSELAKRVSIKNKKILVLTDRVELLTQAGGSFKKIGLNSFYIEAGCKVVSNTFNCYIAMSQTFRRRIEQVYWKEFLSTIDLIVIDECHKQEFNYLFESKLIDNKYLLGFTATPRRSGKMRQLGFDYEAIIDTVTVQELIDDGYLVNDDYYGLETPDMTGVEIDRMKGDYKEGQMFQKFNSPILYSGIVKNYNEITSKTKALIFCVNIEHCIKTAQEFEGKAKFLVSKVSKPQGCSFEDKGKYARYEERLRVYELYKENFDKYSGKRIDILEWFTLTDGAILINAGILTTGYDCPNIETIILNRATISVTLLMQMLGRGSRIFKNKTHFNILDFGDNCSRLGYYTEDRLWGLWHDETSGEGLPPVKDCGFTSEGEPIESDGKKGCRRLIMASYTICPFCGFKYPDKTLREIELIGTVFDTQQKKAIKTKRIKDMTNQELYDYWKIKKHKTAWLWRQLWYKGREKEIEFFGSQFGWGNGTVVKAKNFCRNF